MLKRDFTEEQIMFREAYRKFLAQEIVPNMEKWRETGVVDRSAFKACGDNGFLMVWPEEEYGAIGDTDFRYEQIIIEELAYARCNDFYAPLHSRLVGPYLGRCGSKEQKDRYMPGCVSGDTILAVAMTEPDAGSDLAGMRATARKDGDHWVINGAKTYISNGINCDLVVVAAKTDPENNPHSIGLFLVEATMEGFARGARLHKMGMKAQDTAELFFNDVRVPDANVLGDPAKGFYYLMEGLAEERLIAACMALSAAQLSFDLTLEFVQNRRAFGKSLAAFQNTQFQLADLRTELDIQQCYIDQCVAASNAGQLTAVDASKAKLATAALQMKAADLGVQLHGGAGYMDEYPISRQFTDARISSIYAGTSEIMKIIISRDFLSADYEPFNTRNF
jgi:acyl-CoA dehydrogenase